MSGAALDRVLVIGCGYVGCALARRLAAGGADVVGTTTRAERLGEIEAVGARGAILDIGDLGRLKELLADRDVAFLCVAAGRGLQSYEDVYLGAARSLVSACEGSSLGRVVYTSSTGVYGDAGGAWVDEETAPGPDSENGRVLLEAEGVLLEGGCRLGMDTTVVRLGGIYGPGRDPAERVLSLAGSKRDDGGAIVNLIHLDDIVEALTRLAVESHSGVLNLVDDAPVTRRDYYDAILAQVGVDPIRWSGDGSPSGKRVSNGRIKALLGMTLRHRKRN